ncbi:hypothetical protein KY285_010459 [Solanum tuberosum]|nr:hypothetical protein KY289_011016 [Solanum tuberosum]KAH0734752.1 hypothetical protein KY285_010459 [Solanum tuberosum]
MLRQQPRIEISFLKKASNNNPSYVPQNVWESWTQLWGDAKTIERSEINSKNRGGGGEVTLVIHTGGSISIGEYRKRLYPPNFRKLANIHCRKLASKSL